MAKTYNKSKPPKKSGWPKHSRVDPKFSDLVRGKKSPGGTYEPNKKK